MSRIIASEETVYSDEVKGATANYNWSARFDMSGGKFLGISQTHDDGTIERVLLVPAQIRALKAFLDESSRV